MYKIEDPLLKMHQPHFVEMMQTRRVGSSDGTGDGSLGSVV